MKTNILTRIESTLSPRSEIQHIGNDRFNSTTYIGGYGDKYQISNVGTNNELVVAINPMTTSGGVLEVDLSDCISTVTRVGRTDSSH